MKRVLFDVAVLVTRVVIGVVFIAHGWQKFQGGLNATTLLMVKMGIPFPRISAFYATWVEFVGGILLIAGLLVPIAALLLAIDMLGALIFVHATNGLFVTEGGWEYVAVLAASCLLLAATGGGQYALDRLITKRSAKEVHAA